MATFNILAFDGEAGTFRDGVLFPELLTNDWENEEMVGPAQVTRGIIVGAQRRPVQIAPDRQVLVPANRGQVAWAGDSSPIMRTSNDGKAFAVSGSVQAIRTEAGGTRHHIVAPAEGEKAVLVLVQTGLRGNGRQQEEALLGLLAQDKRIFEHGAFAADDGSRTLVRKVRTAMTRRGGTLTRVNQLIEVAPGGSILVAGMLDEAAVWRLSNEMGRLRKVESGAQMRATFTKLRAEQRRSNADERDQMPAAA